MLVKNDDSVRFLLIRKCADSFLQRQMQCKGASLAGGALYRNGAVVGLDDMVDDGQSESCSSECAAAGLVDSVKPLEEPRQMLSRNSASLILNANANLVLG